MLRVSTVLCLLLLLVSAFGLYHVKYTVHDLREEARILEKELAKEREALHVMRAEWAYLNRPERLRRLAEKHLRSSPVAGVQLTEVSNVPYRGGSDAVTQSKNGQYLVSAKSVR